MNQARRRRQVEGQKPFGDRSPRRRIADAYEERRRDLRRLVERTLQSKAGGQYSAEVWFTIVEETCRFATNRPACYDEFARIAPGTGDHERFNS